MIRVLHIKKYHQHLTMHLLYLAASVFHIQYYPSLSFLSSQALYLKFLWLVFGFFFSNLNCGLAGRFEVLLHSDITYGLSEYVLTRPEIPISSSFCQCQSQEAS